MGENGCPVRRETAPENVSAPELVTRKVRLMSRVKAKIGQAVRAQKKAPVQAKPQDGPLRRS